MDSLKAAQLQKEIIEQEREARAVEKAARGAGGEAAVEGEASEKTTYLTIKDDPLPPLPSPTTARMLDAMPMPPGSSQSA